MSFDTFGDVNYLAVLVGAAVYFAIGGLWYSPPLFAKPWIAASGVTPPQGGRPPVALFVGTFVFELIASLGLAALAVATGSDTVGEGLVLGLVTGVAFALTTLAVTQLYEKRPPILLAINGGYHVVSLAVVGIIVALWD